MDNLERYAKLLEKVEKAKLEMLAIEQELEIKVAKDGFPISGFGITARMKTGRKSIDHQAAALKAGVDKGIIDQFTTFPPPRIAWAKVTKEARISKPVLAEFTTQAPPKFVIEVQE